MSEKTGTKEKKIYIRIVLDPQDPMDKIIIKELKKQRKKKIGRFVKFAVFCHIKGIDLSAPSPQQTNAQDSPAKTTKKTDPVVTRAIREIGETEDIEF